MNKKPKFIAIVSISVLMIVSWAIIYFSRSVGKPANNWWQVGMSASGMLFGVFGILTAAQWNWLKSGIGRGVCFISAGVFMWGVGNAGWTYYLFVNPDQQNPPEHILDILYFSAIPLWFLGIIMLSRATGARYGFKNLKRQLIVAAIMLIMGVGSWYLLVEVARGGAGYFKEPFWNQFFDLGYSIGDAVIATIAIALYTLSWRILGGTFRIPILIILAAFVSLYFADFIYSYLSGKNEYFNGDVADLLYMSTIGALGIGTNLLDPSRVRRPVAAAPTPASPSGSPAVNYQGTV